ncbi:unnamed protein product [Lymnaea stagnalis]|uniref:G-protein coupled receptors family 1 profile domain-containing protein n=1 Tax=Lymnaea stagnalis TaxID=6523 RepID=A0AAV2GXI4_LYMST
MFHSLVAVLVWNDVLGIVLTTPVTIASYINNNAVTCSETYCFSCLETYCFSFRKDFLLIVFAVVRLIVLACLETYCFSLLIVLAVRRVIVLANWETYCFSCWETYCFSFNTNIEFIHTITYLGVNNLDADSVKAAYGYLYSILNLLIQLIMVVCNLVVVVTLVRVRDYRRKHSTCSTNTVMSADCVMDDSVRLQAMAKRRKQKDIELQMIVVMFAITMIFAVCYAPLMIYIVTTLAAGGRSSGVFGLVAIRMASLNQTLNPWLYVILRRTLIIKVKKFCCRWRRCLKKRPTMSPVPVGRRHQYVHVRNQLCHRSNFVGGDINESLSDSMRKSIQQAIPAAMSLPDVMMVNTGRKDLDMLLPDVTKAQSFGGRVSHSYSAGNVSSCVVCNAQAAAGCRECFLERFGLKDPTPPESSKQLSEELPKCPNNSKIAEDSSEVVFGYGRIVYKNDNKKGEPSENELLQLQDCNSYCALGEHSYNAGPTQGGEAPHQRTCHANEASIHSMEECLKLLASGDVPAELCESHSSSGSKKKRSEFVLSPPNEPSHPLFGRSGDSRLSQHRHKPRTNRKSTASVKSNKSSGRPSSSVGGGGALYSPDAIKKHAARTDSVQSSPPGDQAALLDESKDYDDVFEESDETIGETSKNATTDECYLSGNPTESVYFSETVNRNFKTHDSEVVVLPNGLEITHDPKSKVCATSERNNNTTASMKVDQPNHPRAQHISEKVQGARTQFEFHLGSRKSKPHGQEQYKNNGYQRESSGSSFVHDDEGSSGIFSGDSPVANCKDIVKPKWTAKKESQSEITQEERTAGKQPARRVKSYN